MKHNKNKRILYIWLLFSFVMVICMPLPASAKDTTLHTTVPSQFLLKIKIEGKGSVQIGEKQFSETIDISIGRDEETIITIIPAPDYQIGSVLNNGNHMTVNLQGSILTLPTASDDAELTVIFTEKTSLPQTGDTKHIISNTILIILSLFLLIWLIRKRKKI